MKAGETGDAKATVHFWDWRYYANQLKKEKYTVDAEKLRVYFSYDRVLRGMFDIYQSIFRLKFQEIEAPYQWTGDLKLFAVSDSKTASELARDRPIDRSRLNHNPILERSRVSFQSLDNHGRCNRVHHAWIDNGSIRSNLLFNNANLSTSES